MESKHHGPGLLPMKHAFLFWSPLMVFPKEAQARALWWSQGFVTFDDILNIIKRMSWKVILSGDLPQNRVCFSLYCGEEKMKSFYIGISQVFLSTSLLVRFFLISPTQSGFSGQSRVSRMILSTAPFTSFIPTLINLVSQNPLIHILSSKVHFCANLHPWEGAPNGKCSRAGPEEVYRLLQVTMKGHVRLL